MKDLKNEIRGYALKNAIEFGKVDAGRILPKLFNHGLEKGEIKEAMPVIQTIVKEVNSLPKEIMEREFETFKKYVKEREEKERTLPELDNVSDKMVFRLAPYPSGALHLGNAKTYMLNALYAEKYNAKILLVMDDTIGSEEKKISPEAYKLIEDAFQWLGVNYDKNVIYKSDRLEIYYKHAELLIKKEKAYVCHCPQEELRENRAKGKECNCRGLPEKEQKKRWEEMFTAKEGSAVLRIKTSMQHPNPAFRDRVLFKISDREHPRVGKKYRVWPSLEMSWAVDDYKLGITHVLRGNDLMIESDMERYMWDIFEWKHPTIIHTGMLRIEGMGAKLSKSKAQKEVSSGEFIGWDDPRTWSMQSLARRGIKKESIRKFVEEIGLNKQDIIVPVDSLYSINRKMIDMDAQRVSFIEDPVKLDVQYKPNIEVIDLQVHPDKSDMRSIKLGDVYISKKDFDEYKGKEVRLLHLYNVKLGKKISYTSTDNKDIPKLTWVSPHLKAKVLMPDGVWIEGIVDSHIAKMKVGEMAQFERFGFVRFDKRNENNEFEFWFAHK